MSDRQGRSHAWLSRLGDFTRRGWGLWGALALYAITLVNGYRGLDFGFHWDEPIHTTIVKDALAEGTLLPTGFYTYPSATFHLVLLARVVQRGTEAWGFPQGDLSFILTARSLFLAISLVGGLALFIAARTMWSKALGCQRYSQLAGFTAACVFYCSWQVQYHSRWVAPDMLLTTATAAFIAGLAYRWRPSAPTGLRLLPYALAGIAGGTKYQGVFLVLAAFVADTVWHRRETHGPTLIRSYATGVVAFAGAFLVMTPGMVFQPLRFIDGVLTNSRHYQNGHGVYLGVEPETIRNPLDYGISLVRVAFLDLPHDVLAISLAISLLAAAGAWRLLRRDASLLVALSLPFLGYFMLSLTLTVFIVRNFLFLLAPIAVLAGLGTAVIASHLKQTVARVVGIACMTLLVSLSLLQQTVDASQIADRGQRQLATNMASRLAHHADESCFTLSAPLTTLLHNEGFAFESRALRASEHRLIAVLTSQFPWDSELDLATWPGTQSRWWDAVGTREVDYSHYPRWLGDDRVLVISPEQVAAIGLSSDDLRSLQVPAACVTIPPNP